MANCLRCFHEYYDGNNQKCELCSNGFKPTDDLNRCVAISSTTVNKNLFVTSNNRLHLNSWCMPDPTTIHKSKPSDGHYDF